MILYLQGSLSEDKENILCSLSSSTIIFIIRYCQITHFELVFIPDSDTSISMCCTIRRSVLSDLTVTFASWADVPHLIRNVSLPSLHQPELSLVRSGLCVLLRHFVKESHTSAPHLHMIDLLGFRQGSMKMCVEVSGFTKLCEIELPQSISNLMCTLKSLHLQKPDEDQNIGSVEITLPGPLIKLECHFLKKCRVHNDNKTRREELNKMKKYFVECSRSQVNLNDAKASSDNEAETRFVLKTHVCDDHTRSETTRPLHDDDIQPIHDDNIQPVKHSVHISSKNKSFNIEINKISCKASRLQIEHVAHLPHGIRRLKVDKHFDPSLLTRNRKSVNGFEKLVKDSENVKSSDCLNINNSNSNLTATFLADIAELVEKLTYIDIDYEHTYAEGIEMTLADLILYVCTYHLLEALEFNCVPLDQYIPSILQWASHMATLATVVDAGQRSGWNIKSLVACLVTRKDSNSVQRNKDVVLVKEVDAAEDDEDEMELSRCARMKHKALKPEVSQALIKFEKAQIKPVLGKHICGDDVELEWDSLPAGVHPKEGDVPESRTQRKCQQLENLVTAVQTFAKAGNILVDFCSGGGHLGILMAYLMPACQVFLVENKEESLLKACSRLTSLALTNVTMYQCNLDYFIGTFDVGVCLHACGSATDMVLQLCLNSLASFVICPCCYGSIQKTHLLSYPQSQEFIQADITYKDFQTLGHAADQTELNIALEEQGRQCMNLVDTDRAERAREVGYKVTLCPLKPLSCTPKNNLLIGTLTRGNE